MEKKGFTLIELLVVIAIIALLLSILSPALDQVKRRARAAICMGYERQFSLAFKMYVDNNNDSFWVEAPVGNHFGYWMWVASNYYGNIDDLRLCPSAKRITEDPSVDPQGGDDVAWKIPVEWGQHGFVDDPERNYGSYGMNLWLGSIDKSLGPSALDGSSPATWEGAPERHFEKITKVPRPSTTPMLMDCTWWGTSGVAWDDPEYGAYGRVPPTRDYVGVMDGFSSEYWLYFMGRICLDRHNKAINVAFCDGSVSKVMLNELWGLDWHLGYNRVSDVRIPWAGIGNPNVICPGSEIK